MRIVSVEPTPNPNSMKLNLDESLPAGQSLSLTRESSGGAPAVLRALLAVEGVRSVYRVADFIALERFPQADWQRVLDGARRVLESAVPPEGGADAAAGDPPDQVRVYVQVFRGLPMQVKLRTAAQELRAGLPDRFGVAARQAAMLSADFLGERRWVEQPARFGDPAEVGREVAAELDATYDEERLERLLAQALAQGGDAAPAPDERTALSPAVAADRLRDPDWRRRYAALDRLEPSPEALDVILAALGDSNPSVRRLATVYVKEAAEGDATPHLVRMLQDPSPTVRRAAGDCLSDLGDPAAAPAMADALADPSKLVRWRAARFLYEVGDADALPALRAAADRDPEFEVRLQAGLAVERIASGKAGVEPAWKQMLLPE